MDDQRWRPLQKKTGQVPETNCDNDMLRLWEWHSGVHVMHWTTWGCERWKIERDLPRISVPPE